MKTIGIVLLGFLVAVIASEAAQTRRKVQFAVGTLAFIHGFACTVTIIFATRGGAVSPIPIMFFWGGALLAWLGVRTHIESSILLRMLYLIRISPNLTRSALLDAYESQHGTELRLRELEASGFIARTGGQIEILAKGLRAKKIYGIVTMFWR